MTIYLFKYPSPIFFEVYISLTLTENIFFFKNDMIGVHLVIWSSGYTYYRKQSKLLFQTRVPQKHTHQLPSFLYKRMRWCLSNHSKPSNFFEFTDKERAINGSISSDVHALPSSDSADTNKQYSAATTRTAIPAS